MKPLTRKALAALLRRLPGWQCKGNALRRSFVFPSFADALAFMHNCVAGINRLDHHPEWSNVYDRVDVRLTTHDAGNRITARDGKLAALLDAQAKRAKAR